jgi:hypothetical protein
MTVGRYTRIRCPGTRKIYTITNGPYGYISVNIGDEIEVVKLSTHDVIVRYKNAFYIIGGMEDRWDSEFTSVDTSEEEII